MTLRVLPRCWASALVLAACGPAPDDPIDRPPDVFEIDVALERCAVPEGPPFVVDTIASGLEVPWDVAFLSDGRALVTERPGRVRVILPNGELLAEPWAVVESHSESGLEVGLMGIDVRRNADGSEEVFVAATRHDVGSHALSRFIGGVARRLARVVDPDGGHPTTLRVVRLVERDGRGADPTVIVDEIPSFILHGGGALRFGPDGLLYLSNGDGAEPRTGQRPGSSRGKILRFQPDGTVPDANPFPGSPVFALGVRHVQGIAWDPESGEMMAIDHGPTGLEAEGFRRDRDELNVVEPGANLGWPVVTGATAGGAFTSPLVMWGTAIAPGGLSVASASHPLWPRSAFVTGLRSSTLRRIALRTDGPEGTQAICEEELLGADHGRLRLNRLAPDGSLWIGTSNRDGRGSPRPDSDLILRLRPVGP